MIQQLTQPTLDNAKPADIVGLDGNCAWKVAYVGEHWSPTGWKRADHLSIRETVETSLREMRGFWQSVGVWPESSPCDVYGAAVQQPDDAMWIDRAGDPIPDRDGLERSHIASYDELGSVAFESEAYKNFVEYRSGLVNQET